MSFTYTYTRDLVDGRYDIDNPVRETRLANEVETALPGKQFVVRCVGASCNIIFVNELSSEEQTTLNGVVLAHKNNT